jgi:hypothetical protein
VQNLPCEWPLPVDAHKGKSRHSTIGSKILKSWKCECHAFRSSYSRFNERNSIRIWSCLVSGMEHQVNWWRK